MDTRIAFQERTDPPRRLAPGAADVRAPRRGGGRACLFPCIVGLAFAVAACTQEKPTELILHRSGHAFVRGQITTEAGRPAANVDVHVSIGQLPCGTSWLLGEERFRSDAAGAYRGELLAFGYSHGPACLAVQVVRPSGSGLEDSDSSWVPVRFSAPEATDTVVVNLVLKEQP